MGMLIWTRGLLIFMVILWMSCGDDASDSKTGVDGDTDTDTDADGDTDSDSDSDANGDTDTDSDSDANKDTDSETESAGECETNADCALFSDCCNCQTDSTDAIVQQCLMECFVDACIAAQITSDDVHCETGKCVIGLGCDSSKVMCDVATPLCGEGWTPEINEDTQCYTGRCIPLADCYE